MDWLRADVDSGRLSGTCGNSNGSAGGQEDLCEALGGLGQAPRTHASTGG